MNKLRDKIVMLAKSNDDTNIVYNYISKDIDIEKLILEDSVSRIKFIKKRIKKFGYIKVFNQVLFRLIIVPFLEMRSKNRINEIMKQYNLDNSPVKKSKIINVASVNSDQTIKILNEINPCLVIVFGTRIISERVLSSVNAKFVNMHSGITPLYRGVHGGYWALREKNPSACGVTVHIVDSGIDTGNILEQDVIEPTNEDNIATYSMLQLGVGVRLIRKAVKDIIENKSVIKPYPEGETKLWSHPTIWEYLWYRISRKVK